MEALILKQIKENLISKATTNQGGPMFVLFLEWQRGGTVAGVRLC